MAQGTCSVEGCEEQGKIVRGWCRLHYWRWKKYGSPTAPIRHVARRRDVLAVLRAAASATTDECIIYAPQTNVRTQVYWEGRNKSASRVVWIIAHGDPGALDVLHRCNGGSGEHGCINIRHLYLGTDVQNARDRVASGRGCAGETMHSAKLSNAEVIECRRLYDAKEMTITELARRFQTDSGNMSRIVHRKTWRHI